MNQETPKDPGKTGAPVKKVLFIITKATWGGAQRYLFDLVTHLPKERFIPFVAYGEEGLLARNLIEACVECIQVEGMRRDIDVLDDIQSFFLTMRAVRYTRPDVVHLNSTKAAALGALASWICRVPRIVFTVHGWPFKEQHRSAIARKMIYAISWLTALFSHVVITVSEEDERIGKRMWLIGHKVHYVPLGIDTPAFLSRQEAREMLRVKTAEKIPLEEVVYLGTLSELTRNKGIRYAIEALSDLRRTTDEHYILLVFGDGEELEDLTHLARRYSISDRVFFLGFVQNAARYIPGLDIVLLPSLKEGTPYVLLEAGEAGVPAIATFAVSPDVAQVYKNLRFGKPSNALALADEIRLMRQENTQANVPVGPRFPLGTMIQTTVSFYLSSEQS